MKKPASTEHIVSEFDVKIVGPEDAVRAYRTKMARNEHAAHLAARALVYVPDDLAEAIRDTLQIPDDDAYKSLRSQIR